MAEKIGIGIIGCGGIAHPHLDAWKASSDLCEVRGLADTNPKALEALHAKIPTAKTYADYRQMLESKDIQAIEILTPPGLHWQNARDAMQAGKDVIIIKPFVVELRHADDLIKVAKEQGVRLMAGQPMRYEPHMQMAHEVIKTGRIGVPTRFYSRGFMRQEWLNKATHWFSNLSMSGGITIENIVHQTDAMHWMAGPIEAALGYAGTFHTKDWPGGGLPDDQISFMLRFASGAIGIVEGGTAQPTGMPASMFEVMGTEGGMTIEGGAITIGRGVKERDGYAERYEIRSGRGEAPLARAFLESIANNTPVPITAEDGRYAVEVCWAALQSAREGREVRIPIAPENYPTYSDTD